MSVPEQQKRTWVNFAPGALGTGAVRRERIARAKEEIARALRVPAAEVSYRWWATVPRGLRPAEQVPWNSTDPLPHGTTALQLVGEKP